MELSLIVAIIHREKLEAAEKGLQEIGIRGITVIKVPARNRFLTTSWGAP